LSLGPKQYKKRRFTIYHSANVGAAFFIR
jgi:hypothetical protein